MEDEGRTKDQLVMDSRSKPESQVSLANIVRTLFAARYLFLVFGAAFFLWEAAEVFREGEGVTFGSVVEVTLISVLSPVFVWFASKSGERLAREASRSHSELLTSHRIAQHEITERKQVEEKFRLVVESAPNAMVIVDQEGKMVLVNSQTEKYFGYAREELIGQPVEILVPERYRSKHPKYRTDFSRERRSRPMGVGRDVCALRKDGSEFPAEMGLSPIETPDGFLVLCVITDITERKRGEEQLRKLSRTVEQSPSIVIITHTDGNIEYVNPKFTQITGYTPEEVIGQSPRFLKSDQTPPEKYKQLWTTITSGAEWRGVLLNKRKSGELYWVSSSISPIKNSEGVTTDFLCVQEDITERKRAEEAVQESNRRLEEALGELQAAQQQVLQQERLRALGEMASGIAHDFNNALSPIVGFSELLLDRPEHLADEAKATRFLGMINTAGKDAANVVRRLREFYRAREADEIFLSLDLNSLVEQVLMLTQPKWKDQALASGLTIHIETDLHEVPRVSGNEAEVREVLTNLIFNAVDAMPEGGTLTIRTRPDGDRAVLEVSDNGTGMTEAVRQRCLEPFFSTKRQRGGTGLGLAMVYGVIKRHEGTLHIESAPGRGTSFIIHLPIYTEQKAEETSQEAAAPSGRLRVLVVDDEPPVREVAVEYLARDGHIVETAGNGSEGLEKFLAGWFDVVVTDQGMPEMSGDQLATAIKAVAPDKPVILLTGFGDLMTASGGMPAAVDIIVSKPVALPTLRQALAKVTAEKVPS